MPEFRMKIFRWLALAALLLSWPSHSSPRGGLITSVPVVGSQQTVFNMFSPSGQSYAFANLAHGIAYSANAGGAAWASSVTATGYPTNTSPQSSGNSLPFIPNYYGHYKIWWSGTGAFQVQLPIAVYSGGTSTSLNGNGFGNNAWFGNNGATTQPTSGAPIEFSFGISLSGVANAGTYGGTAGLVGIASTNANIFGNSPSSGFVQVNFITGLTAGVYAYTMIDATHLQLTGTTFTSQSINSGAPGVQSEAIMQTGGASWEFPSGSFYSSMSGMVICRSQNTGYGGHDDCTNILAGGTGQHANPDYAAARKTENNRFLRFMDYTQVNGQQGNTSTNYTYRPVASYLSWQNNPVQPYL